jgi:hypothetical protein
MKKQLGLSLQTIQPVVSCCTDLAILAAYTRGESISYTHKCQTVTVLQCSCCMFKSSRMWCPYGLSAWCNIPKVLNLYQTFCHKREMPVHNIQDCWIVLNDTYIGSFSVILFSVKNAHCFGSWLCLWYQVKPNVIKPTALGPLHWAKHHPFTSCMVINFFFSFE